METTRMSSKGQVIIPKAVRDAHGWKEGTEFVIEDTKSGVMLRPKRLFPETTIDEVAGCLKYDGPPVTVEEMNETIEEEAVRRYERAIRR